MSDLEARVTTALGERYDLQGELGRGGMATVFLAEDRRLGRSVAIKVLLPELVASVGAQRFLREIRIVASLQHPNILPLFESGEAEGLLYYVMPLVEGESLRDRLNRETQLPLEESLAIARQVASALAYAHGRKLVHRDIKPANILLTGDVALVADFGVAKAVSDAGAEKVTRTGLAVGTPAYMSPEQAGGSGGVDARTDVYALGCVLYEMLAGEPPFTGPTAQALLARKASETVPGIRVVRDTVPEGVEAAILKALARVPADRFRSADAFVEAIDTGSAIGSETAFGERAAGIDRPVRNRSLAVRMGAMVVILAALGAWWWTTSRVTAAREEARTRLLPEIARLADAGEIGEAFRVASEAEDALSGDPALENLFRGISVYAGFATEPPGARLLRRAYGSDESWQLVGTTPIDSVRVPAAMQEIRFELDGHNPLEAGVNFPLYVGAFSAFTHAYRLDRPGAIPDSMIRVPVPGGALRVEDMAGVFDLSAVPAQDFLIDRYEVTNRQYQAFVDAGGYEEQQYWQGPLTGPEGPLEWSEALFRFTDRTGRPGPATWEGGSYPSGRGDEPVTGVSWYEAAAYARYTGKALPTVYHWTRAAFPRYAEWMIREGNFGGSPVPAGLKRGISRWGALDMAGNAREWCANARGDDRFILGGGFDDQPWVFTNLSSQPPWDRSESNGFRLVSYADGDPSSEATAQFPWYDRDFSEEEPVSDEMFELFLRQYAYDDAPLQAVLLESDSTHSDWIREEVSFDAAYVGERVVAQILLPRGASPPYQAVVFFPGAWPLFTSSRSADELPIWSFWVDFMVRAGRAVALPVFKGTFERADSAYRREPYATVSDTYRDQVITWAQDMRRTVDYLESRPDVDPERIAYYGTSWGGGLGPIMLAVEPRFRAAILYTAGLHLLESMPEVDPFNFISRVTVPFLLLNGRYDFIYPVETSQIPLFELAGTPFEDKLALVEDTGHTFPRTRLVEESLNWLDRYLGPVQ